jgi:hypothetical protein
MIDLRHILAVMLSVSLLGAGCAMESDSSSEDVEVQGDEAALVTSTSMVCTATGVVGPESNGYKFERVNISVQGCRLPSGKPADRVAFLSYGFERGSKDAIALAAEARAAISGPHQLSFKVDHRLYGAYRELRPYVKELKITRAGAAPFQPCKRPTISAQI